MTMPSPEASQFADSGMNSPKILLLFPVLLYNLLQSFQISAQHHIPLQQIWSLRLEFVVKDSPSVCRNICELVLLKPMQEA